MVTSDHRQWLHNTCRRKKGTCRKQLYVEAVFLAAMEWYLTTKN